MYPSDVADQVLGEPFLPWERWAVIHGLELRPDGLPRYRVVLVEAARQNGKTHIGKVVALAKMYLGWARLVLGTAQDLDLARETWEAVVETAQSIPELAAEIAPNGVRRANGEQQLRLADSTRYKIKSANRRAARGLTVGHVNFDELREQRSWDAWAAIRNAMNAVANAQLWAFSNAGDDESVVLNGIRDAGLSGRDPSVGVFSWSAPDGCALDDRRAWRQANPSLGYKVGVSEAAIRNALATDPPDVFRTEVLCQKVETLDGAVDMPAWRDCRDPAGSLDDLRDRVGVTVDVAPDGQHVTLTAAAVQGDGRVRVEAVEAWPDTAAARDGLPGVLADVAPRALAWFPSGPAAALAPVLRPAGLEPVKGKPGWRQTPDGLFYRELTGADVVEACQGFADLIKARQVVHADDPLITAHLAASSKLYSGDGWRFARKGAGHVDAAYAAAGAVLVALTMPEPVKRPRMMVV